MSLSFLPAEIKNSISHLNYNYISEIRIRRGQPVMVEYRGEYRYLNSCGVTMNERDVLKAGDIAPIIHAATDGCIYNYTEQMKNGFITVEHGIRIGIAGEYVTNATGLQAIKNITSIDIRIPHLIRNCSDYLIENLFNSGLHSTLLFSKPGFGKTTMLRDLAINLSSMKKYNILIFDERNEISAIDGNGNGFDLGERVDVVRCYHKNYAISGAIRAMKPEIIITDELYGEDDINAVTFAADCGICVIASSHICNRELLRRMPFEFYAELVGIGKQPLIYDKNFNTYCRDRSDDIVGGSAVCE